MTTHAVCYAVLAAREAGNRPDHRELLTQSFPQLLTVVDAGAIATSSPLYLGQIRPSAWTMNFVPVAAVNGEALLDGAAAAAVNWTAPMLGAQVDGAWLENGGDFLVQPSSDVGFGRQSPPLHLVFAGAVQTAIDAAGGAFDGFRGSALILPALGFTGHYEFIDFDEVPPNTAAAGAEAMRLLLAKMSRGGARYVLGTRTDGSQAVANECAYAAVLPDGRVYVRAGDIGNNNEQIPAAVTANTAGHFRFHPGVFFRAAAAPYIRSIHRNQIDETAIATGGADSQPIGIISITSVPTSSDWLISVDGCPEIVRLLHPEGVDARTPLEIWNTLWVPQIQNSAAGGEATSLVLGNPTQTQTAGIRLNRLRFLDYARCLNINGNQTTITQTGTPAP
jgi:hypothetical protein